MSKTERLYYADSHPTVFDATVIDVTDRVTGQVDWSMRLDHLQQHTGQHILSQAFVSLYGAETNGFRMMKEASEIDIELENPSDSRIQAAVELANEIIWG